MPQTNEVEILVHGTSLDAKLTEPAQAVPGVLFVHGWDSDQGHYQLRAEDVAALGCVCLTFDMRGHGRDASHNDVVTREDNLQDVLAAYDRLAAHPAVDGRSIAVVGTSYGGYLAAILCALRPVRWLGLRVPALYADADWHVPKAHLDRQQVMAYREQPHAPAENRALSACADFEGDALVVGSERDEIVPKPNIRNFVRAFERANSMTHRFIQDADHALSDERTRRSYDNLLAAWLQEMLVGSRTLGAG